jgi:hypothetical protein
MRNLVRGAMALIGAAALLTASAAIAFAGEGYAGVGGGVEGASAGGGAVLPFTGSDMVLYALIAAGVIVSGLVLRSYSARRVD